MTEDLAINRIKFREDNPRRNFEKEGLRKLAESIKNIGVLEPVLVRPDEEGQNFELVAGERRVRAAVMAGLKEIPAMVRSLSDVEVARIQLAENVARAAMSPMEEHNGVARLIELGEEIESVCDVTGRSRDWVQLRLDFGTLPESYRRALDSGEVSVGVTEEVLRVHGEEREKAAQAVLNLGDEATIQRARDMLSIRYILPSQMRAKWAKRVPVLKADPENGNCEVVEDYDQRREYLESWGEPVRDYVREGDAIGHEAADPDDAGITWGEMCEVLQIPLLIVPDERAEPVTLAPRKKIRDLEGARRKAGESYTIGPREALSESDREERDESEREKVEADAVDVAEILNRMDPKALEVVKPSFEFLVERWADSDLEGVEQFFRILAEQIGYGEKPKSLVKAG